MSLMMMGAVQRWPTSDPESFDPRDIVLSLDRSPVKPCLSCGATTNAWPTEHPPTVRARVKDETALALSADDGEVKMSLRVPRLNDGESMHGLTLI
jgi:hypothetical protein